MLAILAFPFSFQHLGMGQFFSLAPLLSPGLTFRTPPLADVLVKPEDCSVRPCLRMRKVGRQKMLILARFSLPATLLIGLSVLYTSHVLW